MEPIGDKVVYTFHSKITDVFEHKALVYMRGVGKDAEFENVSRGWYIHLEGSRESLHLGHMQPTLKRGDIVKVTIEQVQS
jgi:hypothetical protein